MLVRPRTLLKVVFVDLLTSPGLKFVALGYTFLRSTRSTYKCILRGLASGGVNHRNKTTLLYTVPDGELGRTKRGLYPVQARHTECDELSSCRSMQRFAGGCVFSEVSARLVRLRVHPCRLEPVSRVWWGSHGFASTSSVAWWCLIYLQDVARSSSDLEAVSAAS